MLIFKRIKDLQNHLKNHLKKGDKLGFVPTMGALHQGHISLIELAINQCNTTVCSIFVNPTQFNEKSDFDKYPNTIAKDIEMLADSGCDILFLPSVKEIYPSGLQNKRPFNFGFVAQVLEGEHRPGHFNGMAQVVERLLRIVKPHQLYMGQKDYQQQLIVGQLIKKMHFKTELIVGTTVREKDGLAMSSRNVRLDAVSRQQAVEISKTLKTVKSGIRKSKKAIAETEAGALSRLAGLKGLEPEYFAIRNARTLQPVKSTAEKMVALTAVKIGGVRLIDNMLLN